MIFDENLFCGRVFNDAINLSLDSFIKKYGAISKSIKDDSMYKDNIQFILDDFKKLWVYFKNPSNNKVSTCQCWFKEQSEIISFIRTVQNSGLFEHDSYMGSLYYYPENTRGLSMKQIVIHAENTMMGNFVELMLSY